MCRPSPGILALKSLKVVSYGRLGLESQGGTGDLQSSLNGGVGVLKVANDFENVLFSVTGGIGRVIVGGSDHRRR